MRQAYPVAGSRFEIVPVPIIVPAGRSRVLAACAMRSCRLKVASTPALGSPSRWPFTWHSSFRCTLPSCQASPSSSGVTATGEKPVAGFDW